MRAHSLRNSLIAVGYTPASASDPMSGGVFDAASAIRSVKIGTLSGSTFAAAQVGTVNVRSVTTNNGGTAFGVLARDGIGAVRVARPKFNWDRGGTEDQGIGDFHVKH